MAGSAVLDPATWRAVLGLLLAAAVIMGSPGPSTISATAVGAAYGFRRALPYVGGLVAGTAAVLLAVAGGVVALLVSIPHGRPVLVALSAAYILWLAFRIATAPPLGAASGEVAAPAFGGGFLLAIANPKAYLAIAAVFAGSTICAQSRALDALAKLALLGGMIVVIHLFWLLAGASLARLFQGRRSARVVNLLLAASLVALTAVAVLG
jgi:threonine/homoserine/homoserine lactone efflux protein